MAMHDLEILDGILDIDEPAGAVFHIHGAGLDKLFQLLPPEVEGDGEIPRLAAIDVSIPVGFDLFPQRGVSGDGTEFDHGLSFEGSGQTGGAVVADDLFEWISQRALAAMGAQADVEVKDAFLLRLDALQQFLREPFEVFAVLDALFPVGAPHAAVDEEHFDVRGITEFTASELAHAEHCKGTGFFIGQARRAVLFVQLGLAVSQAALDDDFCQFRQRL